MAGIRAADPGAAVTQALRDRPFEIGPGRVQIIAVGKAAISMARAAMQAFATPPPTLIVTNYENAGDVPHAEVFAAGHPVPDENGQKAAQAVQRALQSTGANDRILALISGGGSALLPAPVPGISLTDKARVNQLLLGAGVDIDQMNLVRQQLSVLKGGGFARLAAPAQVSALILSDVIGDDLRTVASGPTVAPLGNAADAIAVLRAAGIWDELPKTVVHHLQTRTSENVSEPPAVENRLVGSNAISVAAMAAHDRDAVVHARPLIGDVADAAREIAAVPAGQTTLFGGETTVVLAGDGLGGRNQELALRVAMLAESAGWAPGWVFLSGGTDGRDGPTDSAGGLVDDGSLARMRAAGVDPEMALRDNDSYHALQAAGDLLITGATGTNVADLQVLIRP